MNPYKYMRSPHLFLNAHVHLGTYIPSCVKSIFSALLLTKWSNQSKQTKLNPVFKCFLEILGLEYKDAQNLSELKTKKKNSEVCVAYVKYKYAFL